MTSQPRVFISYQRADAGFAHAARERLTTHGIATWMDEYDIPAGAYWPDAIDAALAACDVVLGLLSPDSVASRNVKNEWDWALQNDKRLLLVLVRPCVIPHRYISINYIDASGPDPAPALAALVEALAPPRQGLAANPPQTRYTQSGELSIAYQVFGAGSFDLVVTPGFVSNLDWIWDDPAMTRFYEGLASFARVITFDKRGTGLSDRAAGVPSLEQRIDDLRAVMDAAGAERAALMGISEGGSMAVQFAASHPNRTVALVLYGALVQTARGMLGDEEVLREEQAVLETWGRDAGAMIAKFAPSMIGDEGFADWMKRYSRASASPGAVIALRRMNRLIDLRAVLPAIDAPTLVLHRAGDRDIPLENAHYLAAHIPGAALIELPGDDHLPWLGDQDAVVAAVRGFLMERVGSE
ncbi:MAG TPA: alpha/beta fold hydrolase [Thermomicrobiaceae bacterium]|nr:alpha/beta fold hydrolase [Thermomicrobiaceae bacterium]